MKTTYGFIIAGLLLSVGSARADSSLIPAGLPHGPAQVQYGACFRPTDADGCVQFIVAAIENAKTSIRVQAYNFTTPTILKALADAKHRGVDVQIILDKINDPKDRTVTESDGSTKTITRYTGATFMYNAGVLTFIDRKPRIAHNKIIIIDSELVIGGSYNYSTSAEKSNAENVSFVDSKEVASWYIYNWNSRRAVSEPFASSSQ